MIAVYIESCFPRYKVMEYITPQQLSEMILDDQKVSSVDYLIVDVRGDDYTVCTFTDLISQVGNIPGARNIPSHEFLENLSLYTPSLIKVPVLIFHCALSQVRGPKCAHRYALQQSNSQKVYCLQGGFSNWASLYRSDPRLVENYDAEFWENQ